MSREGANSLFLQDVTSNESRKRYEIFPLNVSLNFSVNIRFANIAQNILSQNYKYIGDLYSSRNYFYSPGEMPSFACMLLGLLWSGVVIGAATGGDRWGCVSGPPPVVVVVVVVVQGFKGDVLLKDWSVRHATSLSPIQTLPAQKSKQKLDKYNITECVTQEY